MVANFSPDFDGTNSLLMNRPMGCEYLRPFGAVNCTATLDMVEAEEWNRGRDRMGKKEGRGRERRWGNEGPRTQRQRRGEEASIYNITGRWRRANDRAERSSH